MRYTLHRMCRFAVGQLGALSLAVAMIGGASSIATASGLVHEVRGGVLYHDVPDLWSGFSLETSAPDINLEVVLSPSLPLLWGSIRPALGVSVNTDGGTSHAYIDARWQVDLPHRLFFGLGLGAAIHDGETRPVSPDMKALGARVLFHVPIEIGYHLDDRNSVSVYFEHISNGYTSRFNEGLDRLGIRYGVKF